MGKNIKISPSDVKKLAEECKSLAESLNFNDPIISEEKITKKIRVTPMEDSMRYKNLFEYSIPSDDDRDTLTEIAKESDIYNQIVHDLEAELNTVAEIEALEEGVLDVIRKYAGKKILTVAIIAQLMSTGKVTAQQLSAGGVEPEKIEVAMDKVETDKQGRPDYFNFANVKAIAVQGEVGKEEFSIWRNFSFETYQSSQEYKFTNVPYTLTTSENMANASDAWKVSSTINYNSYKENSVSDTTFAARNDFYIIANEDKGSITYTVSDYPMEVQTKGGDTLKFLGIQVWQGEARNKTPFYNNDKGVEAARTAKTGGGFIAGEGKDSMSVKANSVSINLVYGTALESETITPGKTDSIPPLDMKASDLFKYNSVDVNTNTSSYREMVDSVATYIGKHPEVAFHYTSVGSSSQVPTNYPSLTGEKTIDANLKLAEDRSRSLGIQILKDLKAKGVDISNVSEKSLDYKIGDTKYQNDPQNVNRYLPDQYAGFHIESIKDSYTLNKNMSQTIK